MSQLVTPEVVAAFDHVRSVFPDIEYVIYDINGCWHYMTEGHDAPDFDSRIDIPLLEDAADSVTEVPCIFHMPCLGGVS